MNLNFTSVLWKKWLEKILGENWIMEKEGWKANNSTLKLLILYFFSRKQTSWLNAFSDQKKPSQFIFTLFWKLLNNTNIVKLNPFIIADSMINVCFRKCYSNLLHIPLLIYRWLQLISQNIATCSIIVGQVKREKGLSFHWPSQLLDKLSSTFSLVTSDWLTRLTQIEKQKPNRSFAYYINDIHKPPFGVPMGSIITQSDYFCRC